MARTRKAQSGATRTYGTWRVASTTTGSTTTQAVYRIPVKSRSCETPLAYEVLGTSPIQVRIEWENIYRVSLNYAELQSLIEQSDLDLSNVTLTLGTVDWGVNFSWNIDVDGTFTWTQVSANSVSAGTVAATTSLTSPAATIWSLSSTSLAVSENATIWGTLWVTGVTTLSSASINDADITSAEVDALTAWTVAATSSLTAATAYVTWALDVDWGATIDSGLSVNSGNTSVVNLAASGTASIAWDTTLSNVTVSWNETIWGTLWVTWNSTLSNLTVTGTESVTGALSVNGVTTLNNNLIVSGTSTLTGNVLASQDLTVSGNETVAGNETVTGTLTVNWATSMRSNASITWTLEVDGNTTLWANLEVEWNTELEWPVELDSTLQVAGTAHFDGSLTADHNITAWEQVSAETVRADEVMAEDVRVSDWLYLNSWAVAPQLIMQTEKWAANWVATLDANGKLPASELPAGVPLYTFKVGSWVFTNSNTATITDSAITLTSYVNISNYDDIVWDLTETIWDWGLTVVSNATEVGSFKYFVVTPVS